MTYEGEIKGFGYKKDIESWKDQTNEALKTRDEPYRVVNNGNYIFLQIFTILFFICLIGIGIYFLILINDGKLQSDISNNLTCPIIPEFPSCPKCPDNNCNPTYNLNNTYSFYLDNSTLNKICNSSY